MRPVYRTRRLADGRIAIQVKPFSFMWWHTIDFIESDHSFMADAIVNAMNSQSL